MNVVLRKRNAIFISPFPAHFQQMNHIVLFGIDVERMYSYTKCNQGGITIWRV